MSSDLQPEKADELEPKKDSAQILQHEITESRTPLNGRRRGCSFPDSPPASTSASASFSWPSWRP